MVALRRSRGAESCAVWVVEDDEAVGAALAFSLETEGFRALTFANGAAVAKALAEDCCCLIIDLVLPDIDGLRLLDKLRGGGNDAPAILITTHPSPRVREEARKAGVPIVEKPLLGDTLVQAVRRQHCPRGHHQPLGD